MEKEENKEEEQIITLKDLMKHKDTLKEEELLKIALICKNCGHRDLLINFLKKKEFSGNYRFLRERERIVNPPSKTPYYNPLRHLNCIYLEKLEKEVENYLKCPKCQSSLIVLDKEFMKGLLVKFL